MTGAAAGLVRGKLISIASFTASAACKDLNQSSRLCQIPFLPSVTQGLCPQLPGQLLLLELRAAMGPDTAAWPLLPMGHSLPPGLPGTMGSPIAEKT